MFRSPLIATLMLGVFILGACQPKSPTSLPPKNVPVVEAFSKQKGMCEGLMDWKVEASTKDCVITSYSIHYTKLYDSRREIPC